jgi:hypothetical protein
VDHDREEPVLEVAGVVPAWSSSDLASVASLPWVEVGSGLPPSAQTSRSIMALRGVVA